MSENGGEKSGFEPKILGFLCNWCSYAGADLAGVSRIQYPPNVRVMRVMCSGRVDPVLVVDALMEGIDGVLISGCHIGDCHYQSGNFQTKIRMELLIQALEYTSLGADRFRLEWVSASEGVRFGEVITEFTEKIRSQGPNPLGDAAQRENILPELKAVRDVMASHRIRTMIGKEIEITEEGNVYGEKIEEDRYKRLLEMSIHEDYVRHYILQSTTGRTKTVPELAELLDMDTEKVLKQVAILRRKNMLALESIDGTTPRYLSLVVGGGSCDK
jgi:F420-non-reducing hydrogenase iron-sulfur subunit